MKKYETLLALSDDDPYGPTPFALILEDEGYQVTRTMGRESAMKALHDKTFDLVITDLIAVMDKINHVNSETMAILIVNTSGRLTSAADVFRCNADDYLFHPFEVAELGIRVAHCIEKMELKRKGAQSETCGQNRNEKVLNLLRMMSHDIRGSLVSMSATLKLLIRGYYGKLDEGAATCLQELSSKTSVLIETAGEYLNATLSLNEGRESKEEARDLMQDIVQPVLEELSPELTNHRIVIHQSLISKRISVKAGWIWLKTVFRNLLKNAIQYGEKECTIALGFEDHGLSYQVNVYNSGQPVPEQDRGKLFSKFTRNEKRTDEGRDAEGMGLGLYLIKKIIQKQGGDIWYEAKEDGSNFVFTFPSGLPLPADSMLPRKSAQHGGRVAET